jgi:hypothetical protein
MRIGEIAIVGPHTDEKRAFIKTVSNSVKNISEKLTFGEYAINNQLVLHLYGIAIDSEDESISWDLIAPKLLGYVAIFRWGDIDSFRKIQVLVDSLERRYQPFVVVAAHSEGRFPPLPAAMNYGVPIDKNAVFTFCNVHNENSVRKVLLSLVEKIISQAN